MVLLLVLFDVISVRVVSQCWSNNPGGSSHRAVKLQVIVTAAAVSRAEVSSAQPKSVFNPVNSDCEPSC